MASIIQNDEQTRALDEINYGLSEVAQINVLLAAGDLKISAGDMKKGYLVADKTCQELIQKALFKRKIKLKRSIEDLAKRQRIKLSKEDNEALKTEDEPQTHQNSIPQMQTDEKPDSDPAANDFTDDQDDTDSIIEFEIPREDDNAVA